MCERERVERWGVMTFASVEHVLIAGDPMSQFHAKVVVLKTDAEHFSVDPGSIFLH